MVNLLKRLNNLFKTPITGYNQVESEPKINSTAFIHPNSCIIGDVIIDKNVLVAPFASIRADEGTPIYIGPNSNIQDNVVIHGLIDQMVEVNSNKYSVWIGENVSVAHQAMVHGPSIVGNNVFVGLQSLIFKAIIEDNVVIEHGARVINVRIPSGKYVPAGEVIKYQHQVDNLPLITADYPYKDFNASVVNVNTQLTLGYSKQFK